MTTIKTNIIRIGNSRGVRLPKPLLDQVGLADEVEIRVEDNSLIIRAANRPRETWDERFQAMAEHGDDALLDAPTPTRWDEDEWTW